MPLPAEKSRVIHFGLYEVDLQEQELRKGGIRIKLQEQPFQILTMLLERPGQTVTREEIRQKLWPADTFVDFDHSLNSSINKLREALGDNSENPRFIETLHRRGYRFIAPVGGAAPAVVESAGPVAIAATKPSAPTAPISNVTATSGPKPPRWPKIVIATAAITLFVTAGLEIYSYVHRPASRPFQNFVITQVTNSGKVKSAAISPDGKFVSFVQNDNGIESVWLRNLPTGSDQQIVPPSALDYRSLRFSPDGNYIYFLMGKNPNFDGYSLFRCPVLGGAPQEVVRNIYSFAFSADARRLEYYRENVPEAAKYQIWTSSMSGDGGRIQQTGSCTKHPYQEAWSPKGDAIYYSMYSREEGVGAIDVLDLATGKPHRFATLKDKEPWDILWSPDGSALFATYGQIGIVDSTKGDIEPITHDTNSYQDLSLSADGRILATVMARRFSKLYVLPRPKRQFAQPGLALPQFDNDVYGVGWSADGNLLVRSSSRGLLKLGADGKNQSQFLADPRARIGLPVSCGPNYLVATGGGRDGTMGANLWRTDADGSNPTQLTSGKYDVFPVCSPDVKWVYYIEVIRQRLMRVPLDGSGEAEPMFDAPARYFFAGGLTISPDGGTLAAAVEKPPAGVNIALFGVGSPTPPRILDADIFWPGESDLESTHDDNSVAYVKRRDDVDNLWVNRLDASPDYPITDFKSEHIGAFSFSPDGKRLAILRGHRDSDVVLLQETKP